MDLIKDLRLKTGYRWGQLNRELRSQCETMVDADQKDPEFHDVYRKDTNEAPDEISLQFNSGSVDARLNRGFLKKSLFSVTRQEDGDIVIRDASFPKLLPFGGVNVTQVRLRRGRNPVYSEIRVGIGDFGITFATELHVDSQDYPAEKVDDMVEQAEQLVERGGGESWGFVYRDNYFDDEPYLAL